MASDLRCNPIDMSQNDPKKSLLEKLNLGERLDRISMIFKRLSPAALKTGEHSPFVQWIGTQSEKLSKRLRKHDSDFYYRLSTVVLTAYFLSDLTALFVGGMMPDLSSLPQSTSFGNRSKVRQLSDYDIISNRNLPNTPLEDGSGQEDLDPTGTPVRTTLPFELVGVIVLEDPSLSIATINDKTAARIFAVRANDEIPGKARITSVEARRAVFVNLQSRKNEFVELPEDPLFTANFFSAPKAEIKRVGGEPGGSKFNVQRDQLSDWMKDFNKVLTQARAVPNFENGQAAGYKIFQIVPGSMYDQLGFKNGDVIRKVNGEEVNDVTKAMEYLKELQNSNEVEIVVNRNGVPQTLYYSIQ